MYLDTTILQSRTAKSLVEFIDKLVDKIGPKISKGNYSDVRKDYKEIKRQAKKANDHGGRWNGK
jgi:hypothetical protein